MSDMDDLRRNAILTGLPAPEFERLRRHLRLVEAEVRDQVYEPAGRSGDMYFLVSSVFSMVGVADGRCRPSWPRSAGKAWRAHRYSWAGRLVRTRPSVRSAAWLPG